VSAFIKRIDKGLSFFSEEKCKLWDAWQKGEDLVHLLDDELDSQAKLLVAGALEKIFATSSEGKAILSHRSNMFCRWMDDIYDCEESYFSGIHVARFVRDHGEPHMLRWFLSYLEVNPDLQMDEVSGRVCIKRFSLKRFVRAIIVSNEEPVEISKLQKRIQQIEEYRTMNIYYLLYVVIKWIKVGYLPSDKLIIVR
jgi:hypothetical protein